MDNQANHILTLYDLAAVPGDGVSFSPYVWRVRLALNYKRIPYKTHWVEFPDISEVARSIGAEPTPGHRKEGSLRYTVPILVDPNHSTSDGKPTVLSDSPRIIKYLEDTYPDPRLIPDDTIALHDSWDHLINTSLFNINLAKLLVPETPKILTDKGKDYMIRTREEGFCMPLSQLCVDREGAWKIVREGLDRIAAAMDTNASGTESTTVTPGRVCYADFVLVSIFMWIQATARDDEVAALKVWNNGRWADLIAYHHDHGFLRIE